MSAFGTGGVSALKEFASGGGTIVTISGASVFATLKDVGLTSSKMVGSEEDDQKGKPDEKPSQTPSPSPKPTESPVEFVTDQTEGIAPSLPPIASPSANANKVPEALPGAISARRSTERPI